MYLPRFINEPICDYSKPEHVESVKAVVRSLPETFSALHPVIIGGRAVETGREIRSVSPARPSMQVGSVASCGKGHVDVALQAAWMAFMDWSRVTPEERAQKLLRLAELMRQRRFELLALTHFQYAPLARARPTRTTPTTTSH